MIRELFDKFARDSNKKVVLLQKPNAALVIWLCSVIVNQFLSGKPHMIVGLIGFVAIFIWGLLELFYGVTYFRRTLGLIVLIATIISRL